MNKKLFFLFIIQVGLLTAANKNESKSSTKKQSPHPRLVRVIKATERNIKEPSCAAKQRRCWPNKQYVRESDTLITRYAPLLPAFATLQNKEHGCLYSSTLPELKMLSDGTKYKKIDVECIQCRFKATFFHAPDPDFKECANIRNCNLKEVNFALCDSSKKRWPLDFSKGKFFVCECCELSFITAQKPQLEKQETIARIEKTEKKEDAEETFWV